MAPGHEGFAGEQLFCRAAKVNDGAGQLARLHFCLHAQHCAHMAHAQQVVAAALAIKLALDGLLGRAQGLAQAGQRVVFPQKADDRVAAAPAGFDGGGHSAGPQLHGKAVFLQQFRRPLLGVVFVVTALWRVPDRQTQLFQLLPLFIHRLVGNAARHVSSSFLVPLRGRPSRLCTHYTRENRAKSTRDWAASTPPLLLPARLS